MYPASPDRPERFKAIQPNHRDTVDRLLEPHRILPGIIWGQHLCDVEAGIPPGNPVSPDSLTAPRRDDLPGALEQVPPVRGLPGGSESPRQSHDGASESEF